MLQDIPRLEIPLHTLIELVPKPDGKMAEERIHLDVVHETIKKVPHADPAVLSGPVICCEPHEHSQVCKCVATPASQPHLPAAGSCTSRLQQPLT